jgi:hypothetical protein
MNAQTGARRTRNGWTRRLRWRIGAPRSCIADSILNFFREGSAGRIGGWAGRAKRGTQPHRWDPIAFRGESGGGVGRRRIATLPLQATLGVPPAAAPYRDLPRRGRKVLSLLTCSPSCGAEGRTFESCRARQFFRSLNKIVASTGVACRRSCKGKVRCAECDYAPVLISGSNPSNGTIAIAVPPALARRCSPRFHWGVSPEAVISGIRSCRRAGSRGFRLHPA